MGIDQRGANYLHRQASAGLFTDRVKYEPVSYCQPSLAGALQNRLMLGLPL